MTRDHSLTDIILTDCRKTVLHGQVSPAVYEYLTSESMTEDGWHGRFRLHGACQVVNWRNENGFLGLLALGPVTNQRGSCLLSIRAPFVAVKGGDLTGAHPLTSAAIEAFWRWTRD